MSGPVPELVVGSLCSGYGGLDEGVRAVLGGRLAWVADIDSGAATLLAHRYPGVPNLKDITAVDWTAVEPVDVLTAGFPCQDVSLAGARKGMREGNRSGIWANVAEAIDVLRPQLVVLENVRGLLSAGADSDMEPCPWCVGDGAGQHALRALGAVLGDLAVRGYDAAWCGLEAAAVGAPHGRFRIFVLAWPASVQDPDGAAGDQRGLPAPGQAARGWARPDARGRGGASAADPAHDRHAWDRAARAGRDGSADGGGAAPGAGGRAATADAVADPDGAALREQPVAVAGGCGAPVAGHPGPDVAADADGQGGHRAGRAAPVAADGAAPDGHRAPAQPRRCGGVAADADGPRPQGGGLRAGTGAAAVGDSAQPVAADPDGGGLQGTEPARADPRRQGAAAGGRRPADGGDPAVADAAGLGRGEGRAEPAGLVGRPDAPDGGRGTGGSVAADPDGDGRRVQPQQDLGSAGADQRDTDGLAVAARGMDWGQYAGAIARWEAVSGRRAPAPTIVGTRGQPKLSPAFVEWMMGLPAGWVTAVPGLSTNAQLKILGNGVVPQQAAAALVWLLGQLPPPPVAAAQSVGAA